MLERKHRKDVIPHVARQQEVRLYVLVSVLPLVPLDDIPGGVDSQFTEQWNQAGENLGDSSADRGGVEVLQAAPGLPPPNPVDLGLQLVQ